MDAMLASHRTLDKTMSSHIKSLEASATATNDDTDKLKKMEDILNGLTNSFVEMKDLREDYTPGDGMQVRVLSTPQLDDLFPVDGHVLVGSDGRPRRRRSFGAPGTGDNNIETKATNRYPLRKRATAVRFANRIAKQRQVRAVPTRLFVFVKFLLSTLMSFLACSLQPPFKFISLVAVKG